MPNTYDCLTETSTNSSGEKIMNKRLIANVICCACLTLATAAEARTSYDGPWNLVFVTQHGSCDPTYNFSVDGSRVGDGPRQIRIRVGEADT